MTAPAGVPVTLSVRELSFSALSWGPADGRTVLLLHGFPQRSTSWTAVAGRLAALGMHVVAVDQRGYSAGARPHAVAAYAMPELVADTVAVIEALGGSVDLVGHDWGGVVGWQVAARHPLLVRTWTAVSTPNQLALNELLAGSAEERSRFDYILGFREAGRAEQALLADDGAGLRSIYGGVVAPDRVDADVEFFRQPGVLTAALNWYRAMSITDAQDLPRVEVPTSYIWGSEDRAFSRAAAMSTGAFVDAPYSFVALEGASHWLPDEAPDSVADEVARRVDGA